jgi:GT2 family glycosyltransferase
LREALCDIRRQTRLPDDVIICGSNSADVAGSTEVYPDAKIIFNAAGLPGKRNAILATATQADVIVFFDDDFIADRQWLEQVGRIMDLEPDIVVATGSVIADGVNGPGLTPAVAREILGANHHTPSARVTPAVNAYGCNMALRLGPMRQNGIIFDERLPLYGWQEDVDLSLRLAPHGRVVRVEAASGVHLGVKGGRASGIRLGYSQVANPIYLAQKKAGYPLTRVISHIARNMAMNIARSVRPEPYVDRQGRLKGNLIAFGDLVRGRMKPERILEL